MKIQSLRQIFKITEWRDGCVFRTRKVGMAWVTLESRPEEKYDGNIQFHSPSTHMMREYETMRRVPDETEDIVITTLSELKVRRESNHA